MQSIISKTVSLVFSSFGNPFILYILVSVILKQHNITSIICDTINVNNNWGNFWTKVNSWPSTYFLCIDSWMKNNPFMVNWVQIKIKNLSILT